MDSSGMRKLRSEGGPPGSRTPNLWINSPQKPFFCLLRGVVTLCPDLRPRVQPASRRTGWSAPASLNVTATRGPTFDANPGSAWQIRPGSGTSEHPRSTHGAPMANGSETTVLVVVLPTFAHRSDDTHGSCASARNTLILPTCGRWMGFRALWTARNCGSALSSPPGEGASPRIPFSLREEVECLGLVASSRAESFRYHIGPVGVL
jgi:hypothetical protein